MTYPKYNLLACNRRSKACMSPIVPREGNVLISQDLVAGEPTILLNLTDDNTLKSILFDYKNKKPEWKDGVLLTDSLYITGTSKTDFLLKGIEDVMKLPEIKGTFNSFEDLYFNNSQLAKDSLGRIYDTAKMIVLALIYGLQPSGIVRQLGERGFNVSKAYGEKFYADFWAVLPQAYEFNLIAQSLFKKAWAAKRPLLNALGTPIPTSKPKIAMNLLVQSMLSSFVRKYEMKMYPNSISTIMAIIHDEVISECPEDKIEEHRELSKRILMEVNQEAEMTYSLSLGFKVLRSFHAK